MAFTKINAAGIGSTETVTVDGLTVINNGSFGGNLSVAGVLTYEDVTNVDSIGLITARNGIVVGSGITLSKDGDIFATGITTVSGNVKVGTGITLSPDGDIFATGITTVGKTVFLSGNNPNIRIDDSDTTNNGEITLDNTQLRIEVDEDDSTSSSAIKFRVDGSDQVTIDSSGDLTIKDKIIHSGDTNTAIRFPAADTITAETGGGERLRISSNGRVTIGDLASPDGNLHVYNSSAGSVTAATDANTLILESAANVGMSFLTANDQLSRIKFGDPDATNAGIIIYSHVDDSLRFQHTSNERLRITSTGYVGITQTAPESKLTVFSTDRHVQQLMSETGVTAGTTSGTIYRQQYTSAGTSRRMGFFGIKRDGGSGDQRASFVMELCPDNSTSLGLASPASDTTAFEFTRTGKIIVKNGGGIDFSATADATNMSNELLDDYEEGTFTPAFKAGNNSSNANTTVNEAQYTKIGNMVYFRLYIELASHATGTTGGSAFINGLPYTSVSGHSAISVGYFATWNANQMFVTGTVQPGSNQLLFRHNTSVSSATATMDYDNNLQAGSNVIVSGCYQVA